MAETKLPTPGEISTAIQIWQTSDPGSVGEQEAGFRMADLLRQFRASAEERELAAINQKPQSEVRTLFSTREFQKKHGTIRVEEWYEGLVFWAAGEIHWKSWEASSPAKATQIVSPVDDVIRYLKGLGIREYRVSEVMPRFVVVRTYPGAMTEKQRETLKVLPSMQGVRLVFDEVTL